MALNLELIFGPHDSPATFGDLRKFVLATAHYDDHDELPIATTENLEIYGLRADLREGDNGGT